MNNFIITINRECGSGGGEIARLLGKKLGVKVYDRKILDSVAQQFDLSVENIERIKAQKTTWWDDFCRFYQQFGAISSSSSNDTLLEATPLSVYHAEARLMRELAAKESCIIIGRAGFHVFRDEPNAVHILIIADDDARIDRIARKQNLSKEEAEKVIKDIDNRRDTFVKSVTDKSRLDAHNYDLVINITGMKPEQVTEFLAGIIRYKLNFRDSQ
jgi:cytidylate kinase